MKIQRADSGAGVHRARYHSSCMDVENLDAGQDFDELPETYTILFREKDYFKEGLPLYRIERMNLSTNKLFNDGEHIICVNGEYRDDSELGKLMHDFSCWNPDDMHYELFRITTRYYKENPKGVETMCRAFEEVREQGREQGREENQIESIKNLIVNLKLSAEQAMEALSIPASDQKKLLAYLS